MGYIGGRLAAAASYEFFAAAAVRPAARAAAGRSLAAYSEHLHPLAELNGDEGPLSGNVFSVYVCGRRCPAPG